MSMRKIGKWLAALLVVACLAPVFPGGDSGNKAHAAAGDVIVTIAGNGNARDSGDGSPAVNASGDLLIADSGNNRIRKIDVHFNFAYNGNDASSGTLPGNAVYKSGVTVAVNGNPGSLIRTGYNFAGWNTSANGSGQHYEVGDTFVMPMRDVTLYAEWLPTYTVALDPGGEQTLAPLTEGYATGTQMSKTITVTRTGTGDLTKLDAALSGKDADKFVITQPLVATLNRDTPSTTFTVKAADGLAAGTYTATVTVSATNMTNVTFTVTQVVAHSGAGSAPPEADGWVQVSTAEQLAYIDENQSLYLSRNIQLMNDIDMSGYPWIPFGGNENVRFSGVFDGRGYQVSGIQIPPGSRQYVGFIGESSGIVKNLGVVVDIQGGTFNSEGSTFTGGLIGELDGGSIDRCYVKGNVIGVKATTGVGAIASSSGGLVGQAGNSSITNSYSTATVTSGDGPNMLSGGLIGGQGAGIIRNVYVRGAVSNPTAGDRYMKVGGIVSFMVYGTIENGYATGEVSLPNASGQNPRQGGIAGSLFAGANILKSYFDTDTTKQSSSATSNETNEAFGKKTAEMKQQSTYSGWDFEHTWAMHPSVNDGYPYFRPAIVTTALPNADKNVPYRTSLAAFDGASGGLTWQATGLPAGMSLDSDGMLHGTPGQSGAFDIEIKATDVGFASATATLQLVVKEAAIPTGLRATAEEGKVKLTWEATDSAESYKVYKYEGADAPTDPGKWALVNEHDLIEPAYLVDNLTAGTRYWFAVTAVSKGKESAFSELASAVPYTTVTGVVSPEDINVGKGIALDELKNRLPEKVQVHVRNLPSLDVNVDWDLQNTDYDPDQAGTYKVTGQLQLPDYVHNPQSLQVEQFVIVLANTNARLSGIYLNGDLLQGFHPDIFTYKMEVPYETERVTVTAATYDAAASYEVVGGNVQSLTVGKNPIEILVTAEDQKEQMTYMINVERKPDAEAPSWPDGSELTVSNITQTSVKLSWPSAMDNVGVAGYRIYVDGKERTTVSDSVSTTTINGLTANTHYTFKVTAFDTAGNESTGLTASARTLPRPSVPDTEAPQWPDGSELTVSDITLTSVKLSWPSATDNVGVTGYRICVDGKERTTVSGNVYATTINGLTADTNYTFTVTAFDAVGNESAALAASAKTLAQPRDPDTEAPQWPDGSELTVSDITQTSVKLSWPSATDNVGVTGYRICVDGKERMTVSGNVYATTINGLTANTHYTFTVTAYDAAGNESAALAASAKTLPQPPDPDTEAPSWPDGGMLTVSDITQTSVRLS